jgi:uncharacterized protein with HEPN domain
MSIQEDQVHLNNIITSINEIDSYVENMDLNQFLIDEETQSVVGRNLQMIGDAASMLSDELKDEYGYVDYNVLISLKITLYNIEAERDAGILWDIIQNDLPIIKEDIFAVTEEIGRKEDLSE